MRPSTSDSDYHSSYKLDGLEGVVCLIDDVLIFAADKEEHDIRLRAVLDMMAAAGTSLNVEKLA